MDYHKTFSIFINITNNVKHLPNLDFFTSFAPVIFLPQRVNAIAKPFQKHEDAVIFTPA